MYYKMPKFNIYLLWGKDCDGNILRYYGSTTNMIKRKYNHKIKYNSWVKNGRPINNYNKCSSVHILDNGDWRMDKIEEVIGELWEAKKKEAEYIKNNDCVNIRIENRTLKEYYNDNREVILEKKKKYRILNIDKISEKNKEYRILNKDKISEKNKEIYNLNKDKILKKQKEYYNKNKESIYKKITCECGALITKHGLSRHRKTNKHINFINSANND